ncbi:MAG: hypothetical protein KDK39_11540 [Leptospiraceae bacterium]|nr:hypothetical protein [Leptospiraceae bacterium]
MQTKASTGWLALILLGWTLAVANCQSVRIPTPNGFAEWQHTADYAAASPDAVQLRVRSVENQPKASLEVLSQTARLHFESIGYGIKRSEPIQTVNGLAGYLFVTSVQTMQGEYRYLTAFFPDEDTVKIVEAAGSADAFAKYEGDIILKIRGLE